MANACISAAAYALPFPSQFVWDRPNLVKDFAAEVSANFGEFEHTEHVKYNLYNGVETVPGDHFVHITYAGTGRALSNAGLYQNGCTITAGGVKVIDNPNEIDVDSGWDGHGPIEITVEIDEPTSGGGVTITNYSADVVWQRGYAVATGGAQADMVQLDPFDPLSVTPVASAGVTAGASYTLFIRIRYHVDYGLGAGPMPVEHTITAGTSFSAILASAEIPVSQTTPAVFTRGETYGSSVLDWSASWSWSGGTSAFGGVWPLLGGSGTPTLDGGELSIGGSGNHDRGEDLPRTVRRFKEGDAGWDATRFQICRIACNRRLLYPTYGENTQGGVQTIKRINEDLWWWDTGARPSTLLAAFADSFFTFGAHPGTGENNIDNAIDVEVVSQDNPCCPEDAPCPECDPLAAPELLQLGTSGTIPAAPRNGRLFVRMNDDAYGDNTDTQRWSVSINGGTPFDVGPGSVDVDTGVDVTAGDTITYSATGEMAWGGGSDRVDASGVPQPPGRTPIFDEGLPAGPLYYAPGLMSYSLVGTIRCPEELP